MTTSISQQKVFYKYKSDLDFLEKAVDFCLYECLKNSISVFRRDDEINTIAQALINALLFFNTDEWTDRKLELFYRLLFVLGIC